jgi:hypothetical protein
MKSAAEFLSRFPHEAAALGRILAGYGELEFTVALCLGALIGDDDNGLWNFFGMRGEKKRIRRAKCFVKEQAGDEIWVKHFLEAIDDMDYCREVRNQYAHANWYESPFGLIPLEEIAKEKKKVSFLRDQIHKIDLSLLLAQDHFFLYVKQCFMFLRDEACRQNGQRAPMDSRCPKHVPRPPLNRGLVVAMKR